jgi:leucyl-tRNA synthetase
MSKSKGNGVAPDAMASKYGVDTLRLALMFGAPPESDLNFDENFIYSMKSFLDKVAKSGENIHKLDV